MPRGQRKVDPKTTAELLEEVNAEIVKFQTSLNEAKDRKKALLKEIKEEEKEALYKAAEEAAEKKGTSVGQIIQDLQQQGAKEKTDEI